MQLRRLAVGEFLDADADSRRLAAPRGIPLKSVCECVEKLNKVKYFLYDSTRSPSQAAAHTSLMSIP